MNLSAVKRFLRIPEHAGKSIKLSLRKSEGTAGIIETVDVMKVLKDYYKYSIYVRNLSLSIIRKDIRHNPVDNLRSLYNFFSSIIRYVPDVHGVEVLQSPKYTIIHRAGDCDDMSLLIAVFAESIGIPSRFVIVGKGNEFSHIYTYCYIGSKKYVCDLTQRVFNKEATGYKLKKIM
jgi:hypothetical protein